MTVDGLGSVLHDSDKVTHWAAFDEVLNVHFGKMLELVRGSDVAAILVSRDTPDAKICMEVGAAVFLDKPIVVIAYRGARVPTKLFDIASEVVVCDGSMDDYDFQRRLKAAVDRA